VRATDGISYRRMSRKRVGVFVPDGRHLFAIRVVGVSGDADFPPALPASGEFHRPSKYRQSHRSADAIIERIDSARQQGGVE